MPIFRDKGVHSKVQPDDEIHQFHQSHQWPTGRCTRNVQIANNKNDIKYWHSDHFESRRVKEPGHSQNILPKNGINVLWYFNTSSVACVFSTAPMLLGVCMPLFRTEPMLSWDKPLGISVGLFLKCRRDTYRNTTRDTSPYF